MDKNRFIVHILKLLVVLSVFFNFWYKDFRGSLLDYWSLMVGFHKLWIGWVGVKCFCDLLNFFWSGEKY